MNNKLAKSQNHHVKALVKRGKLTTIEFQMLPKPFKKYKEGVNACN